MEKCVILQRCWGTDDQCLQSAKAYTFPWSGIANVYSICECLHFSIVRHSECLQYLRMSTVCTGLHCPDQHSGRCPLWCAPVFMDGKSGAPLSQLRCLKSRAPEGLCQFVHAFLPAPHPLLPGNPNDGPGRASLQCTPWQPMPWLEND